MRPSAILWLLLVPGLASAAAGGPIQYPETRRVDQKDTYHGVTIEDPYRWLETDVRQSAEVRSWVEAENRVSSQYLAAIPERKTIQERLTRLWNYERRTLPSHEGGLYVFERDDGRQNLPILYMQRSLDGTVPPLGVGGFAGEEEGAFHGTGEAAGGVRSSDEGVAVGAAGPGVLVPGVHPEVEDGGLDAAAGDA